MTGAVPSKIRRHSFTVNVTDIYEESATTMVLLMSNSTAGGPLLSPMGTITATVGCEFQYDLHAMLRDFDVEVDMNLQNVPNWLNFDASKLKLEGRVPMDLPPQTYMIHVTVMK